LNYLAHAKLSFNDPDLLIGNMIADFVKGKAKFTFSEGIQRGINLHRAIDEFTDKHPASIEAKQCFRPHYRLYASAFIDIVYDHFLALDKNEFSITSLDNFSQDVYQQLENNIDVLPPRFQHILPSMKKYNWLYNYRYKEGIQKSFGGLVRRAKYMEESDTAFSLFNEHYNKLKECYDIFYPALKQYASEVRASN
jgi:acyl carrier protein phosphodiesterase